MTKSLDPSKQMGLPPLSSQQGMSIIVASPKEQEYSLFLGTIFGPEVAFEVVVRYDLGRFPDYLVFDIPSSRLQRSSKDLPALKKYIRKDQRGKILH